MDMKNAKWITSEVFSNLKSNNVFKRTMNIVAAKKDDYADSHVLYRKKIKLDSFKNIKIKISADDYYKLYINGQLVGQGPAPCYYFHQYLDVIDASSYFVEGENTIAIHTYYQGLINRVWVSGDYRCGLFFEMFKDNDLILVSDETWKIKTSEAYIKNDNIYGWITQFSEILDFNKPESEFEKPFFDDSSWDYAKIKENADWTLFDAPKNNLLIYEYKDYSILNKSNHSIKIDLNQEICGYIELYVKGDKNSSILIRQAEELNDDGELRYNIRANCDYDEKIILSGELNHLYQFDYKGFRYIEFILPDDVEVFDYKIIARHHSFKDIRNLTFNDSKLDSIYKLCKNTIKYGLQEQFIDCPTREKGQYFGDGVYIALSHYFLTSDTSLAFKMIDNAFESQMVEPTIMAYGPASRMDEIAEYSLMIVILVYLLYKLTNDKSIIDKYYDKCLSLVNIFKDRYVLENGLINVYDKWNVLDWPEALRDGYDLELKSGIYVKYPHTVMNSYYYLTMYSINKMAEVINKKEEFDLKEFKKIFNNTFYNYNTNLYIDHEHTSHSSIGANAFPLLLGMTPNEEGKKNILKMIYQKELDYSNLFISPIVLFALAKEKKYEKIMEIIKSDKYWMNMIKEGATTTFEAFSKEYKYNTSLCHPSFAFPLIFLDKEYIKKLIF